MANRTDGAYKVIILTVWVSLGSLAGAAETIDAADVGKLSQAAKITVENFERESFELRMRYEYRGEFTRRDERIKLRALAAIAVQELQVIEKKQVELKGRIEQYNGVDWDAKFGQTGLWRKLAGDIYITALNRCAMQFYQAICEERSYQIGSLNLLLDETKLLTAAFLRPDCILLRTRIMRGFDEHKYRQETKIELEKLLIESDTPESVYFLAAIENVKLSGEDKSEFLNSLAIKLEKSNCRNNAEIVLPMAFLLRKFGNPGAIESTIYKNTAALDFLGKLILEELQDGMAQTAAMEAELAAYAAWKDGPEKYADLLTRLSEVEKFQSALINYVAAAALAETRPDEAVRLLIKSSRLQNANRSMLLEIDALQIADEAVRLAYDNFTAQRLDSQVTLDAFDNYFEIAGSGADEQIQYLYTVVLGNCGESQKAKEQLEKIAFGPGGTFAGRAELDLIEIELRQNESGNSTRRSEIMSQLKGLFAADNSAIDAETSERAKIFYCQLLIDRGGDEWPQEVLDTLTPQENSQPIVELMRSKALLRMGRFNESAVCMFRAIENDPCQYQADAEELLGKIVEEIDRLQSEDTNFSASVKNHEKLAHLLYDTDKDAGSRLLLVEIEILAAAKMPEKLAAAAGFLDELSANGEQQNGDLLRCRARLLTEREDFREAGRLWAQIAAAEKTLIPASDEPNWQWWRAKYYETYCWSKLPNVKKADVLHTIEVLKNSYKQGPQFWMEKFDSLEKEIGL